MATLVVVTILILFALVMLVLVATLTIEVMFNMDWFNALVRAVKEARNGNID